MEIEAETKLVDISFPGKGFCQSAETSTKNMNASCISAITFDSNPLTSCSGNERIDESACALEKRNHETLVPQLKENSSRKNKEAACTHTSEKKQKSPLVRGSLYSRLMAGFQDYDTEMEANSYEQANEPYISSRDCASSDEVQESEDDEESIVEEINFFEEDEGEGDISVPSVHMSRDDNSIIDEEQATTLSSHTSGFLADQESKNNIVDQWREVLDTRTGKSYFYNRRTRESSWTIPSNGSLIGRKREVHRPEHDSSSKTSTISLHQVSMSGITEDSAFENLHEFDVFEPSSESNHKKTTLYCMYCGKTQSIHELKNHLHFHCHRYNTFQKLQQGEHEQLKLALKLVWNHLGGDKENNPAQMLVQKIKGSKLLKASNDRFDEMESMHASMATASLTCNSDDIFSQSDDEDTILDGDIHRQYKRTFHKGIETEEVLSTCAFCSKTFRSGNKLSKHLLLCKKRQASNRKRSKNALSAFDDVTNKPSITIGR